MLTPASILVIIIILVIMTAMILANFTQKHEDTNGLRPQSGKIDYWHKN